MQRAKEFKVGALALVAITILYLGFNFLKGQDIFSGSNTYYAFYDDIGGLTISNPVMINGVTVGKVSNTSIIQGRHSRVLVELDITSDIQIPKGSIAELANTDFLGSKAIEIVFLDDVQEFLDHKDTLESRVPPGIATLLEENAKPLAANLEFVLKNLNITLENFNNYSGKIDSILGNLVVTTNNLNTNIKDTLVYSLSSFKQTSEELQSTVASTRPLINNLTSLSDSLKVVEFNKMVTNLNSTLVSLNHNLEAIKNADGSMGKLIHEDSLYQNLNQTLANLNSLFIDFQANPDRYVQVSVFGKKDKSKNK